MAVGYDNIGQITSWSAREGLSGPLRLNEQYNYVYDKAGNLWLRTNGGLAQTFNCDALNQLTNVTRNGSDDRERRHTGPGNQHHGERPSGPDAIAISPSPPPT